MKGFNPTGREPARKAAAWDARLRSPGCGDADQREFVAWRDARPENAILYDRLQQRLATLTHAADSDPVLQEVRTQALSQVATSRSAGRPHWAVGVAASVALLAGAGTIWSSRSGAPAVSPMVAREFHADPGQRLALRLGDGSEVMLNSRARLRVAFDGLHRAVALDGEAMFHVAKAPRRPFVVRAAGHSVVAVGTVFSVRTDPAQLQVTMVEGKTRVQRDAAGSGTFLVRGQRLIADLGSGVIRVEAADLGKDTAWIDGRILFEDEPLVSAAAEMSRYRAKPLRIAESGLARLSVNGMFRTDKPERFLSALSALYGIEARERAGHPTVLLTRGTPPTSPR